MKKSQFIIRLIVSVWGTYLLSIIIYPLLVLPDICLGLISRETINVIQGVSQHKYFYEWFSISMTDTVTQRMDILFILVGILVGIIFLHIFPAIGSVFILNRQFFLIRSLLIRNIFSGILRFPGVLALKKSTGDIISRLRGDTILVAGFIQNLLNTGLQFLAGLFALAVLMSINFSITMIVFVPLFLILLYVQIASGKVVKYREASRETTGQVTGLLGDIFRLVQAIQVSRSENSVIERLSKLNDARKKAGIKDVMFNNFLMAIFRSSWVMGLSIITLLVGKEMRSGTFSVGDFALFSFFLGYVMGIPMSLGMFIVSIKQMGVSIQRMVDLMPEKSLRGLVEKGSVYLWGEYPEIPFVKKNLEHELQRLEVKGLNYLYPGNGNGIKNINLTIRKGEIVVVTGRIGSGKSTLLRALIGLLPASDGEILWNDNPVNEPKKYFTPPRCAYIPQIPTLYNDSLKDNLLMGIPEHEVDLDTALYRAVMEDDVAELENGIKTMVGPRGVKLSGGQVKRTAAARMFVTGSSFLVLDDLSSALDVNTEKTLWDRVFENRNATYLVVSHRQSVLQKADHIIVLKNGKLEAEGSLDYLLSQSEEFRHLWSGKEN